MSYTSEMNKITEDTPAVIPASTVNPNDTPHMSNVIDDAFSARSFEQTYFFGVARVFAFVISTVLCLLLIILCKSYLDNFVGPTAEQARNTTLKIITIAGIFGTLLLQTVSAIVLALFAIERNTRKQ
jgi:hypothetical protein